MSTMVRPVPTSRTSRSSGIVARAPGAQGSARNSPEVRSSGGAQARPGAKLPRASTTASTSSDCPPPSRRLSGAPASCGRWVTPRTRSGTRTRSVAWLCSLAASRLSVRYRPKRPRGTKSCSPPRSPSQRTKWPGSSRWALIFPAGTFSRWCGASVPNASPRPAGSGSISQTRSGAGPPAAAWWSRRSAVRVPAAPAPTTAMSRVLLPWFMGLSLSGRLPAAGGAFTARPRARGRCGGCWCPGGRCPRRRRGSRSPWSNRS